MLLGILYIVTIRSYVAVLHSLLNTAINQEEITHEQTLFKKKRLEKRRQFNIALLQKEKLAEEFNDRLSEQLKLQEYLFNKMMYDYNEKNKKYLLNSNVWIEYLKLMENELEKQKELIKLKLDKIKELEDTLANSIPLTAILENDRKKKKVTNVKRIIDEENALDSSTKKIFTALAINEKDEESPLQTAKPELTLSIQASMTHQDCAEHDESLYADNNTHSKPEIDEPYDSGQDNQNIKNNIPARSM